MNAARRQRRPENDIVPGSCIASLLGANRAFQLRLKPKGSPVHEVELADGSLLLMKGATQQFYKHQLPVRRGVRHARFNVTLRRMTRPARTREGSRWCVVPRAAHV